MNPAPRPRSGAQRTERGLQSAGPWVDRAGVDDSGAPLTFNWQARGRGRGRSVAPHRFMVPLHAQERMGGFPHKTAPRFCQPQSPPRRRVSEKVTLPGKPRRRGGDWGSLELFLAGSRDFGPSRFCCFRNACASFRTHRAPFRLDRGSSGAPEQVLYRRRVGHPFRATHQDCEESELSPASRVTADEASRLYTERRQSRSSDSG
jgi:hypothetical protein